MPHSSQLNTTLPGVQATCVMATIITTQARHDCEKIAITGLEPASQDRSSQQSSALTLRPNGLFNLTNLSTYQ